MAGINKVILVGHLGQDPEVRTIDSGAKVARFTLATTESYKDKNGERKDITEWHNIICWRGLADIAEKFLNKGKMIYLEGKIRTRSWEDNGIKKYRTEIMADTFTMLSSGGGNQQNNSLNQSTTISNDNENSDLPPFLSEEEGDLPF